MKSEGGENAAGICTKKQNKTYHQHDGIKSNDIQYL